MTLTTAEPPAAPRAARLRFGVLGPLEADCGGRALALHGVKQRAALGFLLLHAGEVVPTSDLVGALWPRGATPPTARKVLQNAVSGLRAGFARSGAGHHALVSRARGYVLQVPPDGLDLARFDRLVATGRERLASADWDAAADALRESLALWRGEALQDLVEAGLHWPELSRLRGERTAAYEDCFTAELARGRHHAVVEELRMAVERDPMRERMCALLMRALYRCGRQVEALSLYGRHRSALLDRLGLEPGRELRDLEQAILNHDPALARTAAPSSSAPSRGAARQPPAAPAPPRPPGLAAPPRPGLHDPELAVLRGVLEYARRRHRPHLVLIVGGPGTGKSQLVAGLRNAVRREEGAVRCVVGRPGAGTLPDITAALRRPGVEPARDEAVTAWWSVLEQTASVRPLVAVLEDVHDADAEVARRLGEAVQATGAVPLVVVATARPEFLDAYPEWRRGLPCTTLELEDGR